MGCALLCNVSSPHVLLQLYNVESQRHPAESIRSLIHGRWQSVVLESDTVPQLDSPFEVM
jgi:hypothetical protein